MATRNVPARRGVVFDEFAVRPPAPTDVLISRPEETGRAFAHERTTRVRRSVSDALDGRRLSRTMGWAGLSHDGRTMPSLVVLGEPEDIPVLGALALEGLGFEVDPVTKALRPAPQFLL